MTSHWDTTSSDYGRWNMCCPPSNSYTQSCCPTPTITPLCPSEPASASFRVSCQNECDQNAYCSEINNPPMHHDGTYHFCINHMAFCDSNSDCCSTCH
ncbi:hypothetical protein GJ496_003657 [Pomphorhynchus laevis]|nr:hypothetical protein GJ496_003657 [Pomphorhynchus laevis]